MPDTETALESADEELLTAARRAVTDHGDGKVHTVAAAVRDENGAVHVGVNLYHFTGGPCAELVALATARAAGARAPQLIVAIGYDGRGILSPCGRDRQVFVDLYPELRVIVPMAGGARAVSAASLLPHRFHEVDQHVQRLRFRGSHLPAVQAGTKRCTMRFNDPVEVGPALLVFELPERVALPGRVTATVAKPVREVTEQEARADGFDGAADVLAGLRDYYPDLSATDTIVIVTFEVAG